MTYRKLLAEASKLANDAGLEDSAIIILMIHFANMESHELYAKQDEEVPNDVVEKFDKAVKSYVNDRIPVQHITGVECFYGYDFFVNPDCLIPRFETEELVEHLLMTYDDVFTDQNVDVVDIGTGSGCIGITLALEEPHMNVLATDISNEALAVARRNANKLGANVTFLQGDMLNPVINRKFDILVSNPPYIPLNENVDSLVKDHEPHIALFGGDDGLYFYRIILSQAKDILRPKNIIAFEHAFDKGEAIGDLARLYFPLGKISLIKDMQGKDRITIIVNGGE